MAELVVREQRRILVGAGAVAVKRSRVLFGLLWLTATVLTGTAWAGAHALEQESTTTVPVSEQHRISVTNSRGTTVIVGRADLSEVVVRAVKVVRAGDEEEAMEWVRELDYDVETDDNEISIETVYPRKLDDATTFWSFLRGMRYKAQIDYTIEVPVDFAAKVNSASGDVKVTSLRGDVKVYITSGDVRVANLGRRAFVDASSGHVEVESVEGDAHVRISSGDLVVTDVGGRLDVRATSGDVEAYSVAGDVDAEIASGDLLLRGCAGDVHAKAASGDCILSGLAGNVRATAASGSIDFTLAPRAGSEYVLNTASGNVNVDFRRGDETGFLLDVHTVSGTIEGDLDIRLDQVTRRVLRGKVGDGDGHLFIETASGNIRINQSERHN